MARALVPPSSSAFLARDGVEPLPYKWQAWRQQNKLQPAAGLEAGCSQPRALDPPAWSPRPGPSAASWGASCFAGAAPVLAPACPACGSPTEVGVGVPCSCACPWEPQTLQHTQQWGPSQPRAICSASWRDAVTPCIAHGKAFSVIPWDGALTATSGRHCGRGRGETGPA